ncbi:MAG TPA: MATE family efflux transporter [Dehalococcoidales bacterium]|nr:MATE family efflux transporter [Dehalococcoidales bacterium]
MTENENPRQKSPVNLRSWTSGSLAGNLWSLAWPMTINNTIAAIGPTIDMIWVGRLGASAIAGVGVAGMAVMVVNALIFGLFIGSSALIARYFGARNLEMANRMAHQAFLIGLLFSIVMALVGIFFAGPILVLMGVDASVVPQGTAYLRIQLIGMFSMIGVTVAQSIMQASGDSKTPLYISFGYRLLQVALCPLLVFGWWIFPRLEVSGAALSSVITQGSGCVLAIWLLLKGRSNLPLSFKNFRFEPDLAWRALKIGFPASITFMERALAELVMVRFIAPFGTVAVAAQSLTQRIDQFIQNLAGGFGTASGVLGGQSLGAGQPQRAEKTGWLAVGLASLICLVCSAIVWFWIEPILRLFTGNDDLLQISASFLRIQIASYVVWGLVVVISLFLNGIGDTIFPMFVNLFTIWVIQIGLAYVLPLYTPLGVYGIRWAVVAGILVRAVVYPLYYQSGRWKTKKV